METLKRYWNAFRDVAIIFSFAVNFVLVVLLLAVSLPALQAVFALKTGMVEPLLGDLDAAFVGLGEATIDTAIPIEDQLTHIKFTLPLRQTLGINFELPIEQDTDVVLTEAVPLSLPAQFHFPAGGGMINGTVSLSLPAGLRLPIHLNMSVLVEEEIPVNLDVPVDEVIPITMTEPVPVHIKLGEAGLDPAVEELRAVFRPLRTQLESFPDQIELRWR